MVFIGPSYQEGGCYMPERAEHMGLRAVRGTMSALGPKTAVEECLHHVRFTLDSGRAGAQTWMSNFVPEAT